MFSQPPYAPLVGNASAPAVADVTATALATEERGITVVDHTGAIKAHVEFDFGFYYHVVTEEMALHVIKNLCVAVGVPSVDALRIYSREHERWFKINTYLVRHRREIFKKGCTIKIN